MKGENENTWRFQALEISAELRRVQDLLIFYKPARYPSQNDKQLCLRIILQIFLAADC